MVGYNGFAMQFSLPLSEICSVHDPFPNIDFHFLSYFIVLSFTGLTACILYRPFYHMATMHMYKTNYCLSEEEWFSQVGELNLSNNQSINQSIIK